MQFYPLKFHTIYKERLWGGNFLREVFKRELPANKHIGESWELADLPQDKSFIKNGEFTGQTLESVVKKYPCEITGKAEFVQPFPLLVKFLDCGEAISIQVHPDEAACNRLAKGEPKTECWYIVSAKPDAVIYCGLKTGVTREKFSKAIKDHTVEQTLRKIKVKAGQCYFIPAGIPHAIGAGILVAEIETPSDTTFRIYDWDRTDESGKVRPIHIKEAIESIHFDSTENNVMATTTGRLVNCDFFKVDKELQKQNSEVILSPEQMKVLVFFSGSGTIVNSKMTADFKAGETILIPAAYAGAMRFTTETEYLIVTI